MADVNIYARLIYGEWIKGEPLHQQPTFDELSAYDTQRWRAVAAVVLININDDMRLEKKRDEPSRGSQDLREDCIKCDNIERTGDASGKCHKHADGSWSCGGPHDGDGWAGPDPDPIPMQLWCPLCHTRHIDEGEFATKPHHTHSCQNPRCGLTWRPAVGATVGVWTLPGFLNEVKYMSVPKYKVGYPKYKVGDTIKFNQGYGAPDRVMVIEEISANHGGNGHHRYWGGHHGVYEAQVLGLHRTDLIE